MFSWVPRWSDKSLVDSKKSYPVSQAAPGCPQSAGRGAMQLAYPTGHRICGECLRRHVSGAERVDYGPQEGGCESPVLGAEGGERVQQIVHFIGVPRARAP